MRLLEIGKSILLVLLVISTITLTWLTWSYNEQLPAELFTWSGGKDSAEQTSARPAYMEADWPVKLAVSGENGRYGAQYSADVRAGYEKLKILVGEALATAGEPQRVSADNLLRAFGGYFVYLEYDRPIPIHALSGWMGSDLPKMPESTSVFRLLISANLDSNGVDLVYWDSAGGVWTCETKTSIGSFLSIVGEQKSGECGFAFEYGAQYPFSDAYTLVKPDISAVFPVTSRTQTDSDERIAALSEAFKLNPYSNYSYPQGNDRIVTDNMRSIRITHDGRALYKDSGSEPGEQRLEVAGGNGPTDQNAVIEAARLVAAAAVKPFAVEEELCFSGITFDPAKSEYSLTFDYRIAGIPVYFKEGHAAEFIVSGGVITDVEIQLKGYSLTGIPSPLLPILQASAAADGQPLTPAYYDDGQESARVIWFERK